MTASRRRIAVVTGSRADYGLLRGILTRLRKMDDIALSVIACGMHLLPKRGDKPEWQHTQDYWHEKDELPAIDLDDPAFAYE